MFVLSLSKGIFISEPVCPYFNAGRKLFLPAQYAQEDLHFLIDGLSKDRRYKEAAGHLIHYAEFKKEVQRALSQGQYRRLEVPLDELKSAVFLV